ncbi:hypothetical protein [Candidatus Rhodobacter oscarellae]|uniref:hypothetical protein n=1 Tax=Candidatus Rhodobacter oscarellae TaxID=1675527 RepID=UPI001F198F9E|nr:hypothetical protein [Candidatus Rhodobacter lobularis]
MAHTGLLTLVLDAAAAARFPDIRRVCEIRWCSNSALAISDVPRVLVSEKKTTSMRGADDHTNKI